MLRITHIASAIRGGHLKVKYRIIIE